MILKYILQKELIQIGRNPFLPRLIVVFPIMIMCVMPWVMNMEVTNIAVEVVDNDHSTMSGRFVNRIAASRYFKFMGMKDGYGDALADVDDFKADLIVEIPHGYEKDIALGKTPQVLIAANAVNGTKGSMGNAYMSSIAAMNLDKDVAELQSKVSSLYLYNKHLNYKLFMIPSLVAILVMLMCGFLPALNIVSEKEKGTIEAINVTPVGKFTFILGKLIPYWIIALVVMSVCLVIAWLLYGITSAGNLGLVYMLAMLLALFFSGFGILVSNCNDTMQQAVFVMWFTVVCLMLLSGLFTPVRSMPQWAYATTYVNPMHYFIDAIRTVFVRGGDFHSIAHQAGVLAVAAIVINSLAIASYCKNS